MIKEETLKKIGEWLGDKTDVTNAVAQNISKLIWHHVDDPKQAAELILANLSGALASINETELADTVAGFIPQLPKKQNDGDEKNA